MDISLGTLLLFWGSFQFIQVQPLPSPHKQCWTRVSNIFSEFQLCIGWGERELQENFEKGCTVLRGNRGMTEKYEYCSTVPRTFIQDCTLQVCVKKINCKPSFPLPDRIVQRQYLQQTQTTPLSQHSVTFTLTVNILFFCLIGLSSISNTLRPPPRVTIQ